MPSSSTNRTGRKSAITTTAVQISTETSIISEEGVLVYADPLNSAAIYIGFSNTITSDDADTTDGFPLVAGASLLLQVRHISDIWVVAASGSQKLWWVEV